MPPRLARRLWVEVFRLSQGLKSMWAHRSMDQSRKGDAVSSVEERLAELFADASAFSMKIQTLVNAGRL